MKNRKFHKRHLIWLPAIAVLIIAACSRPEEGTGPTDIPGTDDVEAVVRHNFEQGRLLERFQVHDEGRHIAFFDDGGYVLLDSEKHNVRETSLYAWPAVALGDGNLWTVDGSPTAHKLPLSGGDAKIVAAIYDGEGLYFRFSDSRIYYFHRDRAAAVGCYRFEKSLNPQLKRDIICRIDGTDIKAPLPAGTDLSSLIPTVGYRGSKLTASGAAVLSGVTAVDHSEPLQLETGGDPLSVSVTHPKSLPVVSISVAGGAQIKDTETYLDAKMLINDAEGMYPGAQAVELDTEIRGRGNSTWGMPKKPYKLKLAKSASLMGMSDNKHWALLANYSDKSLMRNDVVFEMSRILGMRWTPQVRHVELYLNGAYQGTYMLVEHTRVAEGRIDIEVVSESDNSGDAVTGGYLFEIDERYGEVSYFTTPKGLPVNFKEPEFPTAAQIAYAKNYFKQAEDALYNNDFGEHGYRQYVDVKSFAQNYIIQELTKNVDGGMRLSNFLVKERGGRIEHSHVWDFDLALGNCDYIHKGAEGWLIRSSRWHSQLLKDPVFVETVKNEWNVLYGQFNRLLVLIRETEVILDEAQRNNFRRWDILDKYVWPNAAIPGSYEGEVEYLIEYLTKRAAWLNAEIQRL